METNCADGSSPHSSEEVFSSDKSLQNEKGVESTREGNWSDLTEQALVDIFSRLNLGERWNRASPVCKSWFKASRDPFLWHVVDFEQYFGRTRENAFWWTVEFQKKIDRMVKIAVDCGGGNLRELHVRHCSDESIAYMAQRCPNIQRLSIKTCQNVTDTSVCQIASGCYKIEELDISYCYNISHASLEKIGANCKYLTTLKRNMLNSLDPSEHRDAIPTEYINMAPLSGDDEATVFAKYMPNLKHLEIKFSKLSPKGLRILVDGCPNLEHLDLFGCLNLRSRELDEVTANAKNLKVLIKPNFFIPRASFNAERYGHWQLYDERFQTNAFQI
ncbi:hypothetical protein SUGI_1016180 [Cryptomeria japonica]|uniref:F-box protein SKIP1 n=1 Tax=Cryptomeria japonica TaxID=3369 RepID=UPI0024147CC4|nr:F-box protein SKIP1 [Cryptomeria japonica]GLJ48127.1 hypothetical protein SUGI_1016180 [Cryptomeria japonica]